MVTRSKRRETRKGPDEELNPTSDSLAGDKLTGLRRVETPVVCDDGGGSSPDGLRRKSVQIYSVHVPVHMLTLGASTGRSGRFLLARPFDIPANRPKQMWVITTL